MFDSMLPDDHAIAILKKDHDAVKALLTNSRRRTKLRPRKESSTER